MIALRFRGDSLNPLVLRNRTVICFFLAYILVEQIFGCFFIGLAVIVVLIKTLSTGIIGK